MVKRHPSLTPLPSAALRFTGSQSVPELERCTKYIWSEVMIPFRGRVNSLSAAVQDKGNKLATTLFEEESASFLARCQQRALAHELTKVKAQAAQDKEASAQRLRALEDSQASLLSAMRSLQRQNEELADELAGQVRLSPLVPSCISELRHTDRAPVPFP